MRCTFEFTCHPVHRGELTTEGREALLLTITPGGEAYLPMRYDTNPFVLEDDEVFMRFDALEIRNSSHPGGLDIGFLWGGTPMCYLEIQGVSLQPTDDVLYLRGIEGRQRVESQQRVTLA